MTELDEHLAQHGLQRAAGQRILLDPGWTRRLLLCLHAAARNAELERALDIAQLEDLSPCDQCGRETASAGAAGATDAMHEIFRYSGQVEVDDVRNVSDVN